MSQDERLAELGRFLKDRRARISPVDAGLPIGSRRRVRGLRREEVATLAGIGVSWYTSLENGDAKGVSEATLLAVSRALQLSESEREYVLGLMSRSEAAPSAREPGDRVTRTLHAMLYPAYVITAGWDVIAYNEPFRRAWAIVAEERSFNAIERMFLEPAARRMHGERFIENITPVIAMLRSTHGRRSYWGELSQLRDRLIADDAIRRIWDAYEISSPKISNTCTIDSPIGRFRYTTLTLPIPGGDTGIVVQVPDATSHALFASAT